MVWLGWCEVGGGRLDACVEGCVCGSFFGIGIATPVPLFSSLGTALGLLPHNTPPTRPLTSSFFARSWAFFSYSSVSHVRYFTPSVPFVFFSSSSAANGRTVKPASIRSSLGNG